MKIRMRILAACFLALLLRAASVAATPVEIEFEYGFSWQEDTLVHISRLSDGKISCGVFTRPQSDEETSRKWKKVREATVSEEKLAELERGFDTPELKRAAELNYYPSPDGSSWRLKKKKGAMTTEVAAANPESKAEGDPIFSLGRAIAAAAGVRLAGDQ